MKLRSAVFQFLSPKYQYVDYLKKKFFNVILPYLIVSIPAIGLCLIKNQPFFQGSWFTDAFSSWSALQKVTILYLTGAHFFHFWFIPMIVLFYLFAPAFIWLDRHPKFYKILPLLLCLSLVMSRADDDSLVLQNFIHFTSVYVLGMFCCHYREAVLEFMTKYWLGLLGLAIALILVDITLRVTSSPLVNSLYLNTAAKSILSVVFMYVLWRWDAQFSAPFHRIMGRFADLSFGIYFLHAYIIFLYMHQLKYFRFSSSLNLGSLFFALMVIILFNVELLLAIKKFLGRRSLYVVGC